MCVESPTRICSDDSIIAYKVMMGNQESDTVHSLLANVPYSIGQEYEAESSDVVGRSQYYSRGFHAYKHLYIAKNVLMLYSNIAVIVKVELSDLTFQGTEYMFCDEFHEYRFAVVYVANKCRFLEILPKV